MDKEQIVMGTRKPYVWEALVPVAFMMTIIIIATVLWGMEPHVPLVLSCAVTAFIAVRCGYTWLGIISGVLDSINRAVEALLIIMCVGMLIGAWVWSGTMPAMVYYGLGLISPAAFLPLGCLLIGMS